MKKLGSEVWSVQSKPLQLAPLWYQLLFLAQTKMAHTTFISTSVLLI